MRRERPERERPLAHVLEDAEALLDGESRASRAFLGGLVAGAMVGAAIAGASLVRSRVAKALDRVRGRG